MSHDDRALDPEPVSKSVNERRDLPEGAGIAGAGAVAWQVDRDGVDAGAEPLDDRRPGGPVERESVQKDDRHSPPVVVVGELGGADAGRHRLS